MNRTHLSSGDQMQEDLHKFYQREKREVSRKGIYIGVALAVGAGVTLIAMAISVFK